MQPPRSSAGLLTNIGQGLTFFGDQRKHPYAQRWSLGLQQELPGKFMVEASYVGNRATRLNINRELSYTPATHQSVLTVQGLPPLPVVNSAPLGGYAVWLIHRNGSPVLGAYLEPAPDGHTWAAVLEGDASSYVAVATTQEPRIGSAVPTGPELLRISRPLTPPS